MKVYRSSEIRNIALAGHSHSGKTSLAEALPWVLKQSERLWWFDIVHNVFYRVGMFEGFDEFFEEVFHR